MKLLITEFIHYCKYASDLKENSREQLSGVFFDGKEFSGSVIAKLEDGSGDILFPVDVCSIRALPGLDVHQGHACVERAEIL